MSGNQQDPDLMCEVFILAPTDLLEDHEFPASRPSATLDLGFTALAGCPPRDRRYT